MEVRRLYRDIKIPTKLLIRQPDEKKSKKKKAKAAATAAATENGSGPDSPSINGRTMEAEVKPYFWAILYPLGFATLDKAAALGLATSRALDGPPLVHK